MSKTIKEERLRWVLPIVKKEVKLVEVAKVFPHGTRTLERWAWAYKKHGEAGLEPKSTARKTQENETPIRIKEHIIELRKRTKKCALKLHWHMKKDQEKLCDELSFASAEDLRYRIRLWNMYYNDLEHCGLNGKTPNEFLAHYHFINPPYVTA